MKVHPIYTLFLFGAVAWLWNSRIEFPTVNPGEAVGYDLVTIGLPLGLLFFVARRLRRDLIEKGSQSPNKVMFGVICSAAALMSLIDLLTSGPHRRGAIMMFLLFGISSAVLFVLARRPQAATPSEKV
jgi:hypothetical protein